MSKSRQKLTIKDRFLQVGIPLLLGAVLATVFKYKILTPLEVANSFMEPSFKKGDTVYINKLFSAKSLLVGDVVLAKSPLNPESYILARVLGKPGDQISISKREAFRNGIQVPRETFPVKEKENFSLLPSGKTESDEKQNITVPEKNYYLLCDNREMGIDSRELGPVQETFIIGKVW
ncbi:signal peptidase I [Leptospira idonii]|uniref:Signal peptidase I n=1 Tax=Leptospira idonii TaxID=1193500 RepID=A0A4R9LVI3_9LEPT|nr:signal peptidase I [Leptospira idonii]TGN18200.1 signal peptidase I [Leptospira idonii]